MALDKVSAKKLKARLPYGFLKLVQAKLAVQKHEVTNGWISHVLKGLHTDAKVLRALVEVAEEFEATQTKDRLLARGTVRLTRKRKRQTA